MLPKLFIHWCIVLKTSDNYSELSIYIKLNTTYLVSPAAMVAFCWWTLSTASLKLIFAGMCIGYWFSPTCRNSPCEIFPTCTNTEDGPPMIIKVILCTVVSTLETSQWPASSQIVNCLPCLLVLVLTFVEYNLYGNAQSTNFLLLSLEYMNWGLGSRNLITNPRLIHQSCSSKCLFFQGQ